MSSEEKNVPVNIPEQLYNKIKKRIEDSGFTSVSGYVIYMLEHTMSDLDKLTGENILNKDEEGIKKRLRDMGYMED